MRWSNSCSTRCPTRCATRCSGTSTPMNHAISQSVPGARHARRRPDAQDHHRAAGTLARPSLILGLLVYSPLLTRMIGNIGAMGLSEDKLYNAVRRFDKAGERSSTPDACRPSTSSSTTSAGDQSQAALPVRRRADGHGHRPLPDRRSGKVPSWSKELTHEPVSKMTSRSVLIIGAGFRRPGYRNPPAAERDRRLRHPSSAATASAAPGGITPTRAPPARPPGAVLVFFRPKPDWAGSAPAARILGYIRDVVDRYRLRRHIRFRDQRHRHELRLRHRDLDRGYGIRDDVHRPDRRAGGRPLADVSWPDIRGLDSYTGHKIHSARWDHDYDVTGKADRSDRHRRQRGCRIIPELVKTASKVKVFQRTPGWVLPRLDFAHPDWANSCSTMSRRPRTRPAKPCSGDTGRRGGHGVGHRGDLGHSTRRKG